MPATNMVVAVGSDTRSSDVSGVAGLDRWENFLDTVFAHVGDGITVQGANGLVFANAHAAKLVGFASPEELLAAKPQDIFDCFEIRSEDGGLFNIRDLPGRRVMMGEEAEDPVVLRFRVKESGQERWSIVRAVPLRDASGNIQYAINLFHDITEEKRAEHNAAFLADASEALSSSLDFNVVLDQITGLVVPRWADWCVVTLRAEDGTYSQSAVAHVNPEKVAWARRLQEEYPPGSDPNGGVARVIRTGESEFYPIITEELIRAAAYDEKRLKLIRKLDMSSVMITPIIARGRTIGALTFVYAETGRHFDAHDLAFAEDLGRRIGLSIDNARLHRELQGELEERTQTEAELRTRMLQQEVVAELGDHALKGMGMQDLLDSASRLVADCLGVECCKVLELLPDGKRFVLRAGVGWEDGQVGRTTIDTGAESQAGFTLLSDEPVIVEDLHVEKRFTDRSFLDHHHVVSGVSVPVRGDQGPFGVLSAHTRERHVFTQDDIHFLQSVAHVLATAIGRKNVEEHIRKLNGELEENVRLRTEELSRAQEQDRANLQRLTSMFAHLPVAAVATNEDGIVTHANRLFCEFFSLPVSPEEMIGRSGSEFDDYLRRGLADVETYSRETEEMLLEKKPVSGHELPMKDGRIIVQDFLPIIENGKFHGQMSVYRDVTKERRMDASKSEFMSLASHQLRTPLTAIRWSLGKLSRNAQHGKGSVEEKLLSEGHSAAVRMADTIDTMLAISRVEAGQVQLQFADASVGVFLDRACAPFREEMERRGQRLTVQCPEDATLHTDTHVLQEIVQNLIGNAVKYTPDGGSVTVEAQRIGTHLRIDVRDTGYGIPAHQQAKVFRKFFRGDNIMAKVADGNGLGLYLVSLLVSLLGGSISFLSHEGQGTVFTLLHPLTPLSRDVILHR